jgi:hypothetical protein
MTRQKDFKRLTRARMRKTGESYTAARAQLVAKRDRGAAAPAAELPRPPAAEQDVDYAALAGMSDAAIRAKTGCDWRRWVRALDHEGAVDWPHRDIARYVQDRYGVADWWAQAVTVGYERIKGLRAIGQRRSGSFEANKSRTFPVPVEQLFAAWADARRRRRWLPEKGVVVRKTTAGRSLRLTWPDATSVELWFTGKSGGKSVVQVQHRKLASQSDAEARKSYWSERLAELASHLAAARA